MNWTHEARTYEIADADGLAIFYLVAAEQPTMRGETFDRTAQEVQETLRLGQFKLLDIVAVPGELSPFVGFFEAINGNRQVIGLQLTTDAKAKDAGRSLHILGRSLNASLRGGPRPRSVEETDTDTASTKRLPSRLVERSTGDEGRLSTCPYLTTLVAIGAEPNPPSASATTSADHRCDQSHTLAMTETRLERLCRSTAYKSCRHYRFDPEHEAGA
jgi:hypothetical protein